MPDITFLLIAGAAVLLGSVVQSGVGLGLGLCAAPVIAFVEPELLPGALLIATAVLPMLTVRSEWRHIDWRGLAWGLPARLPGAVAGAWLVGVVAPETLGGLVGGTVLLAVAASVWSVRVRITPLSLVTAGATSGLTGTATSIGGPPLALLYQHQEAGRVRATLGGFFLAGTLISLTALAVGGQLDGTQVTAGLTLIPFVVAGFFAGRPLRRWIGLHGIRTGLLAVVTVSGVVLIGRALL